MKTKSSLDVLYSERKMTINLRNGQHMRVGVIADKLLLKWQRFLLFLYVAMRWTFPFQYLFIKLKTPVMHHFTKRGLVLRCARRPGPEVIKKISCSTQLSMEFFLLINVKMPTIVGILTFMSRKNKILGLYDPDKC